MRLQHLLWGAKKLEPFGRRQEIVIAIFGLTFGMARDRLAQSMGQKLAAEAEAKNRRLTPQSTIEESHLIL